METGDKSKGEVGAIFDETELLAISDVLSKGDSLNRGPSVMHFEERFAHYVGAKYAVSTSSCTAALTIAYRALDLPSKRKKVAVQVNSFWNTVAPLIEHSVDLEIIDTENGSLNIDANALRKLKPSEISAIVVTDLGGHVSDYGLIFEYALANNVPIITDAAHANGSSWQGRRVGSFSSISCFSFSTLKNMVTLGEGGMCCTNDEEIYSRLIKLRECWPIGEAEEVGQTSLSAVLKEAYENPLLMAKVKKYLRPGDSLDVTRRGLHTVGSNFKLTAVQAAVGICQLGKLEEFNKKREMIAQLYIQNLDNRFFDVIKPKKHTHSSWHLFFACIRNGDLNLQMILMEKIESFVGGSNVNRYWPINEHSLVRGRMGSDASNCFPNYYEMYFGRLINLPINPKLNAKWCIELCHMLNLTCNEYLA